MKLENGKLDSDMLRQIVFDKITYRNDDVKVRPGIGEDCALIDFGDYDCVMSTDPISSTVSDIGRLAIHITCNDIASNGIQPLGIMLACMLPEGTTDKDVEEIMEQAGTTAAEVGVEIIGGHTEITPAVRQPVIVSTAIGKAPAGTSQDGNDMQPGDFIMMTKAVGLEGTGIIACDHEEEIRKAAGEDGSRLVSDEEIARAKSFLDLVSVVPEGVAAGKVGTHGMHDITEGGILGAVWEMCQISHTGAEVWEDAIPMHPETEKICRLFDVNPLRLISSGSMIIIVPKEKRSAMEEAMKAAGVDAFIIGVIKEESEGICMAKHTLTCGSGSPGRIRVKIDPPYADEIYKTYTGEKQ